VLLGTLDQAGAVEALKAAGLWTRAQRLKPEGYVLSVTPRRVILAGADEAGLHNGAQTLLQRIERRDGAFRVSASDLADAPAHPFRGVHLYVPPKRETPYFKRLICYLALCKVNTIVLEIGAAMEFKRHPEMNRA